MNNNKKILGKVIYVITLLFLLVILYFAYEYYQSNNFNDFIRSEKNLYTSKFKRDKESLSDSSCDWILPIVSKGRERVRKKLIWFWSLKEFKTSSLK